MAFNKETDCDVTLTICLSNDAAKSVSTYQTFIKNREKKVDFNKSQTINRIITEWAEDRHLTLEVTKKTT